MTTSYQHATEHKLFLDEYVSSNGIPWKIYAHVCTNDMEAVMNHNAGAFAKTIVKPSYCSNIYCTLYRHALSSITCLLKL